MNRYKHIIFFVTLTLVTSCQVEKNKNEESKHLIIKKWTIDLQDVLKYLTEKDKKFVVKNYNYEIEFKKDSSVFIYKNNKLTKGTWHFIDNERYLRLIKDDGVTSLYQIVELSEKKLVLINKKGHMKLKPSSSPLFQE